MIRAANLNHLWAALLIEECVRNGVDTFCICPGSRSAPLTVSVARNEGACAVVHYDERGAAFYALGYARVTGIPAALITTSGSALANVWPAVVEASLERVPLLVLSADRPPELQDTGANQTMDQVKFFGAYTRWSAQLPCPSVDIDPAMVLSTVDQAVSRCLGPERGVVHINCMFREPLAPTHEGKSFDAYLEPVRAWCEVGEIYTRYDTPSRRIPYGSVADVAAIARRSAHGLVVAGRLPDSRARRATVALSEVLGWPLLADVSSGLRLDSRPSTLVPHQDIVLSSEAFRQRHPVQCVLHVGGRLTSKRLLGFLQAVRPRHYVVVDDHPERLDPIHRVTRRLRIPVDAFCDALRDLAGSVESGAWLASWREASERVERAFTAAFSTPQVLSEPLVSWLVSRHIGAGEGLFLASSMPIRDMDTYGAACTEGVEVGANRGASGVDGTIASAAGFARGLRRPVTLVAGDLALLHDLNSLRLLRGLDTPMAIVLLNNDGGGIFSFLPIAEFSDVFEPFFATPHGMTFEHAAALFGLEYVRTSSTEEFVDAYVRARRGAGATLMEVRTERRENRRVHEMLQSVGVQAVNDGWHSVES